MAEAHKFEFEAPAASSEPEDAKTLAAIDEGLKDCDAGRTLPAKEARKRLGKWLTNSSTRKER